MSFVIRRFEEPDEGRRFRKGRFDVIRLGGLTLGRASYAPGWRWSTDVGPRTGSESCPVEHVGLVLQGRAHVVMDDGAEIDLAPGDAFHILPGHDSWVVGEDPYVSLHFLGAETYAE
ncbi:MAG: cupin domain-containing protein [Thermoplasmata archaeon]|nr:cupin domain-containing protein [Thermoplasmata archaeon]